MTVAEIMHRELIDAKTQRDRLSLVDTIVEALWYDPRWGGVGKPDKHRVTAERIAFQRHRLDDLYHREGVSLRNRRVGRP